MAVLSDAEIESRLTQLSGWSKEGGGEQITKRYEFPNFVEAIAYVQRIAGLAEEARHHPDITINYNKVTLTLSTHDEGGITEKDFDAAGAFEAAAG